MLTYDNRLSGAYLLLNQKRDPIGACSPRNIRLLVESPRSHETIELLDDWHRKRLLLQCLCKRLWHVVEKTSPFLRRNPGHARRVSTRCDLCAQKRQRVSLPRQRPAAEAPARIEVGLILRTPVHSIPVDGGQLRPPLDEVRPWGIYSRLLETAGLTSLTRSIFEETLYERLRDALARVPVPSTNGSAGRSLADFAWTPGRLYRGGLRGLTGRLLENWPAGPYQPEGWAFGLVPSVHFEGGFCTIGMPHILRCVEIDMRKRGERVGSKYRFRLAVTGQVLQHGPYLALLVCSANRRYSSRPVAERLLLQRVADWNFPVPIESQHEREVALLLLRRRIPFIKPLFPDDEGFRPDFILPLHKVIIEVQGMEMESYKVTKAVILPRMMASPQYAGYRLLTYDANEGQAFESFDRELRRLIQ